MIKQALEETDWVVAHAAKRLRMGRTTLVEKMRKFEMHRRDERQGMLRPRYPDPARLE